MSSKYKIEPKRQKQEQPQTPQAANSSGSVHRHFEQLLTIETAARGARSLTELQYVIANESLKLLRARQVIIFRGSPGESGWRIEKISSIANVDRNAPLVRWLFKNISAEIESDEHKSSVSFELSPTEETVVYPFSNGLYLPIKNHDQTILGGFCLLSEVAVDQSTKELAQHLQGTFSHAWSALAPNRDWISKIATRRNALFATVGVLALMCVPVPLTVLAPVEVVARDPAVIAAPIQGVIEKVLVKPNSAVGKGTLLFTFNKLENASRLAIAEREMEVARAKFQRATQSAFLDHQGRKELAVTKAEYQVARAEYEFASAQLALTDMVSPTDGVAIFSNIDDWEGRPVSIGERVMRLADPAKTAFKIELPVSDAVMLEQDLGVRVFLDANPIAPYAAHITRKSFAATRQKDGLLAFPVHAEMKQKDRPVRIGWRGTAQLSGNYVPLAYNLFRKPLSAIRQYLGL